MFLIEEPDLSDELTDGKGLVGGTADGPPVEHVPFLQPPCDNVDPPEAGRQAFKKAKARNPQPNKLVFKNLL
jgi:hypothetical protein